MSRGPRSTRVRRAGLVASAFAFAALLAPGAAPAATINVTVSDDPQGSPNGCTLNQAIQAANTNAPVAASECEAGDPPATADDLIMISAFVSPIILNGALPAITEAAVIIGPGRDQLTVARNPAAGPFRIFNVVADDVGISGMTISGGKIGPTPAARGGGIQATGEGFGLEDVTVTANQALGNMVNAEASGGGVYSIGESSFFEDVIVEGNTASTTAAAATPTLVSGAGLYLQDYHDLEDVTVRNNIATAGGATNSAQLRGAGIYHVGNTLFMRGVTVNDNSATATADSSGGSLAMAVGGGLFVGTNAEITRSTFEGNSVAAADADTLLSDGGGIYFDGFDLDLTASTLSGNQAGVGANFDGNAANPIDFANTILANPQGGGDNCDGTPTSLGYNLASDSSCALTGTGDQQGANPMLNPLGDNGGPTETMPPMTGSPAIDKGFAFGLTIDQRGETRPIDFCATIAPAVGGDDSDIGAVEVQGACQPPSTGQTQQAAPETCEGREATIVAQPGRRITYGTRGDDVIVGTGAGDEIRALAGDDVVCARGGADDARGGPGSDTVLGEEGGDDLRGKTGGDDLDGGPGGDDLNGGAGTDDCAGGGGGDSLVNCE
jgi:hypothetical protein